MNIVLKYDEFLLNESFKSEIIKDLYAQKLIDVNDLKGTKWTKQEYDIDMSKYRHALYNSRYKDDYIGGYATLNQMTDDDIIGIAKDMDEAKQMLKKLDKITKHVSIWGWAKSDDDIDKDIIGEESVDVYPYDMPEEFTYELKDGSFLVLNKTLDSIRKRTQHRPDNSRYANHRYSEDELLRKHNQLVRRIEIINAKKRAEQQVQELIDYLNKYGILNEFIQFLIKDIEETISDSIWNIESFNEDDLPCTPEFNSSAGIFTCEYSFKIGETFDDYYTAYQPYDIVISISNPDDSDNIENVSLIGYKDFKAIDDIEVDIEYEYED